MNERKTVIAINLETLDRHAYPSFVSASEHCGISKYTVQKCYHNDLQYNGWYFCDPSQLEARKERIRYLSDKWKKEGMPIRKRETRQKKDLVSLRIDDHTCILVTPDKATEEYAEIWRQKYKKSQSQYRN